MLNLIGAEVVTVSKSFRVDDALHVGHLLNYPSRRNAALPRNIDPPTHVVGRPGGFRWPVDVYRDGAFYLRFYSTLSPEGVRAAFEKGDPASHWVALEG